MNMYVGVDELIEESQVGKTTLEKLCKVIKWVQRARSALNTIGSHSFVVMSLLSCFVALFTLHLTTPNLICCLVNLNPINSWSLLFKSNKDSFNDCVVDVIYKLCLMSFLFHVL
jgi:hypothetical protein